MSTKMISGWWSVILASASKPSSARITLQPACTRKISALRRIVFESSITITLTPARLVASLTPSAPKFPLSFTPTVCRTLFTQRRWRAERSSLRHYTTKSSQNKALCVLFQKHYQGGKHRATTVFGPRPPRSAGRARLHFDHLEILLPGPAFRASPVHGNVVPARPRRDSFLRESFGFVVDESTDQTHPGFEI